MKVLTFGELLLRLSAPGYERLLQTNSLNATFCGGEANVSVSLSCFGIQTSFVTKLPDNDLGFAAVKSLNYFNVDTSKILYGKGRMGTYYLEKGASQRPSKIIYDRQGSSFSLATKDEFDWDELFKGIDWFHWTGITPALSNDAFLILLEACKKAKERGITISCDLNYRKKLWTSQDAQKSMKQLLGFVDVCIGNEEDAQLSLGIRCEDCAESNGFNLDIYRNIAQIIEKEYGCKYIAFTLRESFTANRNNWSAVLYHQNQLYISKKYDIQIVDRVGGGDSFSAGLIYGLLTNMDCQTALEFSVAASCLKHTIEGDFNRVTVDEVKALILSNGNGRIIR